MTHKQPETQNINNDYNYQEDSILTPGPRKSKSRNSLNFVSGLVQQGRLLSILAILAIILVIIFAITNITGGFSDFLGNTWDAIAGIFGIDDEIKEVDKRTVVLGIQELSLLQTGEETVQIDKSLRKNNPVPLMPNSKLRVNYIGTAYAGIDLSEITEDNVILNPDGSVQIKLPPTHLTNCSLGKPEVLDRECYHVPMTHDCDKVLQQMHAEAYDLSIDELRETALEGDLLETANNKIEGTIVELLNSFGFERVSFERSTETLDSDDSCYPEPDPEEEKEE